MIGRDRTDIYVMNDFWAIFGIVTFIFSDSSSPKDRAAEAGAAAAGGAMFAGSCLFQLIILGIMALVGLWLLNLIFG